MMLQLDPAAEERVELRGEDLWVESCADGNYSDVGAEVEAEILAELRESPWREVVTRRFAEDNAWLYSIITDQGRGLFLDLLAARRNGVFLDVGSGWGQVAIPLSKWGHVFCLDLTLSRLNILREIARQEAVPLHYLCGNFRSFPFGPDQFDLVVFNGSLEWIALGATDVSIWETQLAALRKTRAMLKPGGLVYVGIENAIGLKYVLGAPDDHSGISNLTFLSEGAARALCQHSGVALQAKTWSLAEYRMLFEDAGLHLTQVYGCFPDYKLTRQMIPIDDVDAILSQRGLLCQEHSGVDGSVLPFGDSLDHLYRVLGRNGVAHCFCPSYGLVAEKRQ
jgi:SAM-dependent methyltransferase